MTSAHIGRKYICLTVAADVFQMNLVTTLANIQCILHGVWEVLAKPISCIS